VGNSIEHDLPVAIEIKVVVQIHSASEPDPCVHLLTDNSILMEIGMDPLWVKFLEPDGDPDQYKIAQTAIATFISEVLEEWWEFQGA
jgi:hypothetical protein